MRVVVAARARQFWKQVSAAIGGGEVRIANNTITCDGPWLVVYRGLPPPHLPFHPMPEEWISEGVVRLSVAKGTLVPSYEMQHASRKTSFAQPGSAPKRQRRAHQQVRRPSSPVNAPPVNALLPLSCAPPLPLMRSSSRTNE